MFRKAGYRGTDLIMEAPLVKETLDKVATELVQQPIRQAARFPILILVSLEVYVLDTSKPPFKRLAAGALLFRCWGTFRFDDQQHIVRHQLRAVGEFAISDLLISKTSGPGKRLRQLPIAIAFEADLTGLGWLVCFLELLSEHLPGRADYLMDGCSRDYRRATGTRQSYAEAAATTTTLMKELRVPKRESNTWKESEVLAIPDGLQDLFTQHTPRTTVPSLAVHIEPDKSKRDALGRWMPGQAGGSTEYVRTYRDVVGSIQVRVAAAIKEGRKEVIQEADILDRAARHLRERKGWDETRICGVLKEWEVALMNFSKSFSTSSPSLVSDTPLPLDNIVARAQLTETAELAASKASKRVRAGREKKFVITYSRGRKTARLHSTEKSCFWAVATVRDAETFDFVSEDMYDFRCKFCWPELNVKSTLLDESKLREIESGSGEGEDLSSDSSAGDND